MKKLLRTARNVRILHVPMEWMNKLMNVFVSTMFQAQNMLSKHARRQDLRHFAHHSIYLLKIEG
jgi:hypothetical protein